VKKTGWIDFHTHSLLSDGLLLPSELISRARTAGYSCIGLTDHVDASNLDSVVRAIIRVCQSQDGVGGLRVLPGVELTYVPPKQIKALAMRARELGAVLVLVHGETTAEPVPPGTNAAALAAEIDILAHPGLITSSLAKIAARNGIALEITTRGGHNLSNGHVARIGQAAGARLVLDTDTHTPENLLTPHRVYSTLQGAGLTPPQVRRVLANNEWLKRRLLKRLRSA